MVQFVRLFFITLQLCMGNWVTCSEITILLRCYQF